MSKPCKYCQKEITWDDSKKAFENVDGSKHDCRTEKLDKPSGLEEAVRVIVRDELRRMKA